MEDQTEDEIASEIATRMAPMVLKLMRQNIKDALAQVYGRRAPRAPAPVAASPAPAPAAPAAKAKTKKAAPSKSTKAPAPKKAAKGNGEITLDAIRAALTGRKDGLRSEALRSVMGLRDDQRRTLAARLTALTEQGYLSRKGQKRTTTYTLTNKK